MDPNWYVVGRLLPLGRLIGHNPPPEERAEERELCRRLARNEHLEKTELDVCLPAANWAWIGAGMTSIALVAGAGLAEDATGWAALTVVRVAATALLGVCWALAFLGLFRNAMLDRSFEDADSRAWLHRLAERLYRPRRYDFWLAAAVSVPPTLWASGVLG
ncbi:hypothetical protein [Streptomyces showdoensis]|uniref:hypothetical protein n=1 Tax=Streptomyces showdoensis TaxID=68268 RepID=UPI00103B2B51|nr:hypothetical protein [Streptomyces showdoensis]